MMRKQRKSLFRPALAVAVVLTALAIGAGVVAGQDSSKHGVDPYAGLSDQEIEAKINGLRDRNKAWVEEFNKSGDISKLPLVELTAYSAGVQTLEDAKNQAAFVIAGTVLTTTYRSEAGSLTNSVAVVQVGDQAKGKTPSTIEVEQVGGPTWSPTGGELQQLEGDPLLLPGQDVVLLLHQSPDGLRFQTVYGAGVYVVTAGRVEADQGNALAGLVDGLTPEATLALFD